MAVKPSGPRWEVHEGTGPHLLLVHGVLTSRAQWMLNLEALRAVSRPVVLELYGHGRSPSPDDPDRYRPEAYVAAFESIRAELGAERWLVCGQSLGAALTLRYALDHPDRFIAQVFTNSNSALAQWPPGVRAALAAQAERVLEGGRAAIEASPVHPRNARRLPESVKQALLADSELLDPRGVALTNTHTVPDSPVRDRIHENKVPSLLVVGTREKRFAPAAEFARAQMPNLKVVEADAGHAVNIEAAPTFNTAVRTFLSQGTFLPN